jgi:hypothetical protein
MFRILNQVIDIFAIRDETEAEPTDTESPLITKPEHAVTPLIQLRDATEEDGREEDDSEEDMQEGDGDQEDGKVGPESTDGAYRSKSVYQSSRFENGSAIASALWLVSQANKAGQPAGLVSDEGGESLKLNRRARRSRRWRSK